jgi:hypothetical protein
MGEGKGVGGGAKSYDGEKAWPSINHEYSLIDSLKLDESKSKTSIHRIYRKNYCEGRGGRWVTGR